MRFFSKENAKPTLVLTAICFSVALLLALVNLIAAPQIAENQEKAFQKSLTDALAGASSFEEISAEGFAPENGVSVTGIYREADGLGYVIAVSTKKGYTGNEIAMTVGITADGKIANAIVTATAESKVTDEIKAYPGLFAGKNAEEAAAVDTVAGVTFSSKAYRNCVTYALQIFESVAGGEAQ